MRKPSSEIGEFVRSERRALGWTQEHVALYAGVSRNFVGDLEAGKPTLQVDSVDLVLGLFGKRLGLVDAARVRR
jgi:HTH-type transcriptional regulator/antitoxin HipB